MRFLTLRLCDLLQFLRDNVTYWRGLPIHTCILGDYTCKQTNWEPNLGQWIPVHNTCAHTQTHTHTHTYIYICIYVYTPTHKHKGIVSSKNRHKNLTSNSNHIPPDIRPVIPTATLPFTTLPENIDLLSIILGYLNFSRRPEWAVF